MWFSMASDSSRQMSGPPESSWQASWLDVGVVSDVRLQFQEANVIHNSRGSVIVGMLDNVGNSGALLQCWGVVVCSSLEITTEAEIFILEIPCWDSAAMGGGD